MDESNVQLDLNCLGAYSTAMEQPYRQTQTKLYRQNTVEERGTQE